MATKRYTVPETSVVVTTDMVWGLEANISSNVSYQLSFGAMLKKYSSQGVQSLLGSNIVQIGVVDSNTDFKEGTNYSAALTVIDFLRDKKFIGEKTPTLYLIKLNDGMYYALGLRGPQVIVDKTIPVGGEPRELSVVLNTLRSEVEDHNFLYGSDASQWKLVVLSKVDTKANEVNQTEDGESSLLTDDFIATIGTAINAEVTSESEAEYTLTDIFRNVEKKKLHPIKNISQLSRKQVSKIVLILAAIMACAGTGIWYKSDLDEAERTRLALLEQQSQQRLAELKRNSDEVAKQKLSQQVTDVVQLQKASLRQEERWIEIFESTNVADVLRAIEREIGTHPIEVNGWDLEKITFRVSMDLLKNGITIDTKSHFNNLRTHATLSEIANAYNNIKLDLSGSQVVVSKSIVPTAQSTTKKIPPQQNAEVDLISILQTLQANSLINTWNLRAEQNKRPIPLPEALVDTLATSKASDNVDITSESWLHPLAKYRVAASGKFISTIREVETMVRHYPAPLLITGVQYMVSTQEIQMEFVTYAHK